MRRGSAWARGPRPLSPSECWPGWCSRWCSRWWQGPAEGGGRPSGRSVADQKWHTECPSGQCLAAANLAEQAAAQSNIQPDFSQRFTHRLSQELAPRHRLLRCLPQAAIPGRRNGCSCKKRDQGGHGEPRGELAGLHTSSCAGVGGCLGLFVGSQTLRRCCRSAENAGNTSCR